jgi:nucleotide-binding universal stress UspA family protein
VFFHDRVPSYPRSPLAVPRLSVNGMNSVPEAARRRHAIPPPFGRIVCGIDGGRSSTIAAEQAIALSGPSTALVFVCVREERGAGATHLSTITTERADTALEAAVAAAHDAGVDAAAEIVRGHDPGAVLLDESSRSDLLVLASHGGSRASGIAFGSTASAALHRATVPVLVARRPPDGVAFPRRILVGTDGSDGAARAVELTARIGHAAGAELYVLSVGHAPNGDPARVAVELADLNAALGRTPVVVRDPGDPSERILALAASERVSLIALGSRGLTGLRALGSVSERVAHRAPCSVLVARPA